MKLKLFITSLFIFGVLLTGFPSSALSITSVEKIEEQPITLEYTQTLRRGVKNNQVFNLQKKLKEMGYYTKELDSDYGSGTLAAVIKFQNDYGLKPDGIAGPKTYAKILNSGKVTNELPKVCTLEYAPVCGQEEINCITAPCPQPEPKTYGNKCGLTAAGAKYLYAGECKKEGDTKPTIQSCTKEYKPVCGEMKPEPNAKYARLEKTFSNKCMMYNAGAEFKYFGVCKDASDNEVKPEYSDEEKEDQIKLIEEKIKELQELLKELQK